MESEEKGVKQDAIESREASGEAVEEAVSDVNPHSEARDVCGETAVQQEDKQEELGETSGQDAIEGQDSVEGGEGGVVGEKDQRDEEEERSSGSGSEESSDEGEGEGEAERKGDSGARSSQWSSREEKMKRLRELHKRRVRDHEEEGKRNHLFPLILLSQLDARQLNHREVVEEDRRNKLPANWEARQRRVEWEEQDEKARQVSGSLMGLLDV